MPVLCALYIHWDSCKILALARFVCFFLCNFGHVQDCEGFKCNDAYSFDGEHQKQDVAMENLILVLRL